VNALESASDTARSAAQAVWQRLPQPARDAAKSAWALYAGLTSRNRVLPGFLIIGTQRGGTTSLYNYLVQHPSVAHALTKELRFFDINYAKGVDWYRSRFPSRGHLQRMKRAGSADPVVGEASPDYLFDPHVPNRVAETLPDTKLIVLLRHPVDRAFSHYWHQVKRGHERLTFDQAVAAEEGRLAGELERMLADPAYVSYERHHHSYVARGMYVEQLEAWAKLFPRDRFLIEQSEDLFADPSSVFKRTLRFLGLPDYDLPAYETFNAFGSGRMDPDLRARLAKLFQPHNERLYEFLDRNLGWKD